MCCCRVTARIDIEKTARVVIDNFEVRHSLSSTKLNSVQQATHILLKLDLITLAPYIQIVGRILRVIVQNSPFRCS